MIVITSPRDHGPTVHTFPDMESAAGFLMALARCGIKLDAGTIWKRKGRAWVPAFPWQHKAEA